MQFFNQLVTAITRMRETLKELFVSQHNAAVTGTWTDSSGAIFERHQDGSFTDLSGSAYTPISVPTPFVGGESPPELDQIATSVGYPTDPAYSGGTFGTVISLFKSIYTRLTGTLKIQADALPLPTNSATESTLQALLRATQNVGSSVWTDDSGAFYIQRQMVDDATNNLTISYTDGAGNPATPGTGLKPATAGGGSLSQFSSDWVAKATTAEYTIGDTLTQLTVYDVSQSPPTLVLSTWLNINSSQALTAAPPPSDIGPVASNVTVGNTVDVQAQALPLPTNAAKETGGVLADQLTKITTIANAQSRYAHHVIQQIDESIPGITYIRKAGANAWDGWLIVRIVESGTTTTVSYAGMNNNMIGNGSMAWSSRTFLGYGDITGA